MKVKLLGAAEALLAEDTYEVPDGSRSADILRMLASEDEGLRRQLITEEGGFRRSSRVLLDGIPVTDYNSVVPADATIVVAPTLSCDG